MTMRRRDPPGRPSPPASSAVWHSAFAASAARPAYAYPSYGYGSLLRLQSGGYYPSSYGYHGSSYYGSGYYGGGYVPAAGYEGGYYDAPACYWHRRRVAIDPYTYVVRRVRVCN